MKENLIKRSADKKAHSGFTLIEMLIVVLIIAILAAIALPQYTKAVERARMGEAVAMLRQIAQANQRYYLATGSYLTLYNTDKLDIEVKGEVSNNMVQINDFLYAIGWRLTPPAILAYAQRVPSYERYYLFIDERNPNWIRCVAYETATPIQTKLCNKISANGTL